MDSDEDIVNGRRELSESELIRYKKDKRKLKQEKLLKSLDKRRKIESQYEEQKQVAQQVSDQVGIIFNQNLLDLFPKFLTFNTKAFHFRSILHEKIRIGNAKQVVKVHLSFFGIYIYFHKCHIFQFYIG